jgi:hypothetical protein
MFTSSKLIRDLLSSGTLDNPEFPQGLETYDAGGFPSCPTFTIRFGFRHHDERAAVGLIRRALFFLRECIDSSELDCHRMGQCINFEDDFDGGVYQNGRGFGFEWDCLFRQLEHKLIIED